MPNKYSAYSTNNFKYSTTGGDNENYNRSVNRYNYDNYDSPQQDTYNYNPKQTSSTSNGQNRYSYNDYSQNRCDRCGHKLSDPSAKYGPYCADLLGYNTPTNLSEDLNYNISNTEARPITSNFPKKENLDKSPDLMYNDYDSDYQYNNLAYTKDSYPVLAYVNTSNPTQDKEKQKILDGYTNTDLIYHSNILKSYIEGLGGINHNIPPYENFQVLYDAYPDPSTGKTRYNNYTFSVKDAVTLLVMTGGNVNFVLQLRDVQDLRDSEGNVDYWKINEECSKSYISRINTFILAEKLLKSNGYNIASPRFYIGAAENKPETLIGHKATFNDAGYLVKTEDNTYDGKGLGIYQQVISGLGVNKNYVAGAYYGEDINPYNSDNKKNTAEFERVRLITKTVHELGGKTLFIPFYAVSDRNYKNFIDKIKTICKNSNNSILETQPFFDTIIIQPGNFFYENSPTKEDVLSLADTINEFNTNGEYNTKFGLELEFDMGLVTGRSGENYEKKCY